LPHFNSNPEINQKKKKVNDQTNRQMTRDIISSSPMKSDLANKMEEKESKKKLD
jgi:hypothetical protein